MNFLKDHFEKLVLVLVLILSVGGIGFIITNISASKQSINEAGQSPRMSPSEYESTDISGFEKEYEAISQPIQVGITGPHELLNPVRWEDINGTLVRSSELGIKSLSVTSIKPLYRRIVFVRSTEYGQTTRYVMEITEEGADSVGQRKPTKRTFEAGKEIKGVPYILERVDGARNAPNRFVVVVEDESTGVKDKVELTPDAPYESIIGYAADFIHTPTDRTFSDQRVNDTLKFDDATYDIVAITSTQATLENKSGKRTTLDFNITQ